VTDFVEANRALWDEWADVNARSTFYRLHQFKEGETKIRPYELEEVGDVRRKTLLHLQCHFGMDTLSWAREGAVVTGVDFSERAVELARGLAEELGLEARFIQSDLYALPEVLDEEFDVVYTSRGVLGWLPDIDRWGAVAARFVKPGGIFYVTEVHPFFQVFEDEGVEEPTIAFPYWSHEEPLVFPVRGSYADREATVQQQFEYGWNHSLGEVVTSLARAGLRIEFLHEFPFLEWPSPVLEEREEGIWRLPGHLDGKLPLFFSLRATKPA
jgi:ubiquinone/menaquinone biosynthesis C-methylase UbiE